MKKINQKYNNISFNYNNITKLLKIANFKNKIKTMNINYDRKILKLLKIVNK